MASKSSEKDSSENCQKLQEAFKNIYNSKEQRKNLQLEVF